MKTILLFLTIGLSASAFGRTMPEYKASYTKTLAPQAMNLLSNCSNFGVSTKKCDAKATYRFVVNDEITVPKGFRQSAGTKLIVNGDFSDTESQFSLIIDGVAHTLADTNQAQEFPLSNGTNTTVSVKVASNEVGRGIYWQSTQAKITTIKLKADNSALIQSVLQMIEPQMDMATSSMTEHKLQKKLVGFFDNSDAEIRILKEALTGRSADDFTTQCPMEGEFISPEECQYLRVFNDILQGVGDIDYVAALDQAYARLKNETAQLGKIIAFLQLAAIDESADLASLYNDALTYVQGLQEEDA